MGDASRNVPLPPPPLADRVLGGDRLDPAYDPVSVFDTQGAEAKQTIRDLLSPGCSFEGRCFLGYGAGKLLRRLLPEAEAAEIYGCTSTRPASPGCRLLKDDGLIIATFMGTHLGEAVAGERWSEDETGMTVFAYGGAYSSSSLSTTAGPVSRVS